MNLANRVLIVLRKIDEYGNQTVHIPGWAIFGLFVFVLPALFICVAWTFPICKTDNQSQCLIDMPNVRIYMSLASLGFPITIGVLYLKFRSLYKRCNIESSTQSQGGNRDEKD